MIEYEVLNRSLQGPSMHHLIIMATEIERQFDETFVVIPTITHD